VNNIIRAILISLFATTNVCADYISNGFFVVEKNLDFSRTIRSGACQGIVPYPVLSHDDEELFMEINDEIHDFVELYAVCNQGRRDHFSVKFDIPESGTKEYFSVRWITNRNKKPWRIDVLTFNKDTGDIIEMKDVFNMLSNNMMGEIIKLSDGHLSKFCKWEDFLEKVEKKDIQFYIEKGQWFIIFNATASRSVLVDVKIPEFFMKGGDHDIG
jgi:hypothetical protein